MSEGLAGVRWDRGGVPLLRRQGRGGEARRGGRRGVGKSMRREGERMCGGCNTGERGWSRRGGRSASLRRLTRRQSRSVALLRRRAWRVGRFQLRAPAAVPPPLFFGASPAPAPACRRRLCRRGRGSRSARPRLRARRRRSHTRRRGRGACSRCRALDSCTGACKVACKVDSEAHLPCAKADAIRASFRCGGQDELHLAPRAAAAERRRAPKIRSGSGRSTRFHEKIP